MTIKITDTREDTVKSTGELRKKMIETNISSKGKKWNP